MEAIRRELEAVEKALLSRLIGDAPAAVIIVANQTSTEVALTIAEPGEKGRRHTIAARHVQPVTLWPAELTSPLGKWEKIRVDPYRAYVFLADESGRVRVEGIELPGRSSDGAVATAKKSPKRDAVKRDPVKIPVTLMVDDVDPRTPTRWQADVRKRFNAAAEILEAQTGFRLEVAGFDTWKSDPKTKTIKDQLTSFEMAVRVKNDGLAIGFISRRLDQGKGAHSGAVAVAGQPMFWSVSGRQITRASESRSSSGIWRWHWERSKVRIPARSCDRRLGDGQVLHTGFVIQLDPLNALALNLWADQRRVGIVDVADVPPVDRARLLRIYQCVSAALPGDVRAKEYVREFEKYRPKSDDPVGDPP